MRKDIEKNSLRNTLIPIKAPAHTAYKLGNKISKRKNITAKQLRNTST